MNSGKTSRNSKLPKNAARYSDFFIKHNFGILSTLSVADLGKIMAVRERMDRQCEQDILSLKSSNRLVTTCRGLRRRVENLERVTRDHQGKLADLCDDTRDINKKFGKPNSHITLSDCLKVIMSSRDIRRLPQKAIDDAKRARNPWNL